MKPPAGSRRAELQADHRLVAPPPGERAAEQRLVAADALRDWSVPFSGPFLYHAGRRHMPPPLRAFVDFLRTEAPV